MYMYLIYRYRGKKKEVHLYVHVMGHVNMLDIMHVCNQSFMNNTQYYYVQK